MRSRWAWYDLLVREPWTWLFIALFQPQRFRRESGNLEHTLRISQMLRLALPLFLCALLVTLITELLFIVIDANLFHFTVLQALFSKGPSLLEETIEGIALGIAIGVIIGIKTENRNGIAACLIWGTVFGLLSGMFFPVIDIWNFVHMLLASGAQQNGIGGVLLLGPEAVLSNALYGTFVGLIAGTMVSMLVKDGGGELARGTLWGFIAGFIIRWLLPSILSPSFPGLVIITFMMGCAGSSIGVLSRILHINVYKAGSLLGLLAGGIAGLVWWTDLSVRGDNIWPLLIEVSIGLLFGGMLGLFLSAIFTPYMVNYQSLFYSRIGTTLFIVLLVYYSYYSYPYSDYSSYAYAYSHSNFPDSYAAYYVPIFCATLFFTGIVIGALKPHLRFSTIIGLLSFLFFFSIFYGPPANLLLALWPLGTFIFGYFFGHSRLLFYPISSVSMLYTHYNCRKDASHALFWLQGSSLHWDEHVSFPLPKLNDLLLTAMQQDKNKTLQEIAFIMEQRPQQIPQIRAAIIEAALSDLEGCNTLSEIAQFHLQFNTLIPRQIRIQTPEWVFPFDHLHNASRAVDLYYNLASTQLKRKEINAASEHLNKLQPKTAFSEDQFNQRLQGIMAIWQECVRNQIVKMEEDPQKSNEIVNPYKTGNPLELRDTIFKGRKDLSQRLALALNMSDYHPTFLLYGERRMGKSSILNHLPNLLEPSYLTIFYNLQRTGILSSITAFFTEMASSITQKLQSKGMRVKGLDPATLDRASLKNEAAVYAAFNKWLENVVQLLTWEKCVLLLAFDEFERLADAGKKHYIDLPLLLDWFRTIIQDYPAIVLLFSGVSTFNEMDSDWDNHFVNVEFLKVSFLNTADTLELITEPVLGFPKTIFDAEVAEEILHVTHGHPFLVQAICEKTIRRLNLEGRQQAVCQDVTIAVDEVFEGWSSYFRDLWERTTEKQRSCLIILTEIQQGDVQAIAQHAGYSDETVRQALEKLLKRDLILRNEKGIYQISAPLFSSWVEQSIHQLQNE